MLFHFENRKGILVKVFDSQHKEIASYKELCKIVDINTLNVAKLKALYAVNNEAVLFIEQDIENKQTLVRLRFSSITGKLVAEDKLVRSESFTKPIHTTLLQSELDDRYYVISVKEKKGFVEKEMSVTAYTDKHEVERTIPISVDQKGYDAVGLSDASIDKNGNLIASVVVTKIIKYPSELEQYMVVSYLPVNGQQFIYKKVKIPQVGGLSLRSSFNSFSNSTNALVTLHFYGDVENAKGTSTVALSEQLLMTMDEGATTLNFAKLANAKIKKHIATEIDTNQFFSGSTIKMHTNQFGLTTIVYDGYTKYASNIGLAGMKGLRRNISFSQVDEKGNEIYGIALPASRLTAKEHYQEVFGTNSEENCGNKECFNTKSNFYVAFNDVDKNFNLKLIEQKDSVYNVEYTSAVYYKLNRKREVVKNYLFGQPVSGEYKRIYPASSDFDEKTNTYAVLYRYVAAGKPTMHVAWVTAD